MAELTITQKERDLAARLVLMGAVAPMNLDHLSVAQLDEVTENLPELYRCTIIGRDVKDNLLEYTCHDASEAGLGRQIRELIAHNIFKGMPDGRIDVEYSPDAWKDLLHSSPDKLDLEALQQNFQRWDLPVSEATLQKGFEPDAAKNIEEAERLYRVAQMDLYARLVRMGISKPMDLESPDWQAIDHEIAKLPLLVVAEVALKGDDDSIRRLEFISVVDYRQSKHLVGEDQKGFDYEWEDTIRNAAANISYEELEKDLILEEENLIAKEIMEDRKQAKTVARESEYGDRESGVGSDGIPRSFVHDRTPKEQFHLALQERAYFHLHPEDEGRVIHRSVSYKAGLAWLDYFKKGLDAADPKHKNDSRYLLTNLKSGLRNWELKYSPQKIVNGFASDSIKIFKEAQTDFLRSVFSKVATAGVVPFIPLQEWHNLSLDKAQKMVDSLPLLINQSHPYDWLQTLNVPGTPENIFELESMFSASGIQFDVKKVSSVLPAPESINSNEGSKKMAQAYEMNLEDYQRLAGMQIANGRLEMTQDEMRQLDIDLLKDFVRMGGQEATVKQKVALSIMADEGRVKLSKDEILVLTGDEARHYFRNAPERDVVHAAGEPLATERTKRDLQRLMDKGLVPKISTGRMNALTENEGKQIVQTTLALTPATFNQKQAVRNLLASGNFDGKLLNEIISKPNITERDIESLSMLQASKVIGLGPASPEQIKRVQELIDLGKISSMDLSKLTSGKASDILDEAYSNHKPLSPDGPATAKQVERLDHLEKAGILKDVPDNPTFAQAKELLDNAPASPGQMRFIDNLVHDGKLEPPTFYERSSMTSAVATQWIDVGMGKSPEAQIRIAEPDNLPVTEAQLTKLAELHKQGKIDEIPNDPTKQQASKIIGDAVASEPITIQQEGQLRKLIDRNLIPSMSEEQLAILTQKEFQSLRQLSIQNSLRPEPPPAPAEPAGKKNKQGKAAPQPAMER